MNSGPTISIGSTGHDVRRLQRIFVMTKVLAPSNITGSFDSTTEQAVKDFQQGAGLTVDGIVGPITWQALPADPNTPLLARGASGSVVTALQKGLKKYSTPATDPGAVDGDFGPKTEAAVKAYQQDRGVQKRTESSATRRGGFPREPRVLRSPLFPDLRRCDLSRAESNVAK
jgi:peptidoglycan hydrolase-like protein with peptidoglycan-binding domain